MKSRTVVEKKAQREKKKNRKKKYIYKIKKVTNESENEGIKQRKRAHALLYYYNLQRFFTVNHIQSKSMLDTR